MTDQTPRPDGFDRQTLEQLAAERGRHVLALIDHQYAAALPAVQVAEHTLTVLALSERLAREARASRWVYATEALAAGATPEQVSTATGLHDAHALRAGVRDWAHRQVEHGFMAPARRDEVLALVADIGLPPRITPALVAEMRAWLPELHILDTAEIARLPDLQILDAVERHWAGGLAAFLHEARSRTATREDQR